MTSLRLLLALLFVVTVASFAPNPTLSKTTTSSVTCDMGFFDNLFGGGKKATASHILIKGPKASQQCEQLKNDIYKKAVGSGDMANGVEAEKLMQAVSYNNIARMLV